jgi:hypothetical protein
MVTIPTRADHERRPWARRVELSKGPSMNWIGQDGKPFSRAPGIRTGATLDTAAAEALFAGARRPLSAVLDEAAREGGKPKGFALKPTIKVERQSDISRITSPNVLAVLPGSDPALAGEHILLMAHLDHEASIPTCRGTRSTTAPWTMRPAPPTCWKSPAPWSSQACARSARSCSPR